MKKQSRKVFKLLLILGQSGKYMCIRVIVKKIFPVPLGNIDGPWAIFYILLPWPF